MVQNIAPPAVSRAPGELEKIAQRQLDGVEAVAEEFARGHQEQHQELQQQQRQQRQQGHPEGSGEAEDERIVFGGSRQNKASAAPAPGVSSSSQAHARPSSLEPAAQHAEKGGEPRPMGILLGVSSRESGVAPSLGSASMGILWGVSGQESDVRPSLAALPQWDPIQYNTRSQ